MDIVTTLNSNHEITQEQLSEWNQIIDKRLQKFCKNTGENIWEIIAHFNEVVDPFNLKLPSDFYPLYLRELDTFLTDAGY